MTDAATNAVAIMTGWTVPWSLIIPGRKVSVVLRLPGTFTVPIDWQPLCLAPEASLP